MSSSSDCPLCESPSNRRAFIKNEYAHFECSDCGALFVSPRPVASDLARLYRRRAEDTISSVCWSEDSRAHQHWRSTWRRTLGEVKRRSGLGPLLDLGCGTGQFLAYAAEQGWHDLTGVEILPQAAKVAKKHVEGEILTGDLTEISLDPDRYAGVFLWDIVEHVGDVRALLRKAHRLLRPGGSVVIGTVNRRGVTLRLLKSRALTVSPPEHLTFFTRVGLFTALAAANLEAKRCWSESVYLREWSSEARARDYAEWRSTLTGKRFYRSTVSAANLVLKLTNLGDELIAIAQKRGAFPTERCGQNHPPQIAESRDTLS